MLDELLDHPGVEEVFDRRSRFGFMAFHGGNLERVTDVIARAAAERSGASYYGVHQPEDLRWHVPSKLFDPTHSERLRAFLDHVDAVVAVHGYGRDGFWTHLLLGGRGRSLARHVASSVRDRLHPHGYTVLDDLAEIPKPLRGQHPDNPVNRGVEGVQLELPPRVRGLGPRWADPAAFDEDGLVPPTRALIDGLAEAASSWSSPRRDR